MPGIIILGIIAATAQAGINTMGDTATTAQWPSKLTQRLSRFAPMKSLSDKEYEDLILNKLLKVEAEISVLDDQIADLRAASKQQARFQLERSKETPT